MYKREREQRATLYLMQMAEQSSLSLVTLPPTLHYTAHTFY